MKNQKKKSFPRRVFLCLLAVLLAVCIAFGVYVSDYYHADLTDSGLRVYAAYGSEGRRTEPRKVRSRPHKSSAGHCRNGH